MLSASLQPPMPGPALDEMGMRADDGCVRVAVTQDAPGRLTGRAVRRDPLTVPAVRRDPLTGPYASVPTAEPPS
jgi:hypothetical protein